ncbi:hypothetical protein [Vibrio gangliei]|uniref:hypothetical protein n=1 Tax=Vibrio gangliei TaxID=2077090 RepID=UPI0013003645|nr:hypothetical protein [Vibrio gangliei]
MKKYMLVFTLIIFPITSFSQTTLSGYRNIKLIGCHKGDNTCYVTIDGEKVGPTACQSDSLRWNTEKDANGKEIFSLLNAAFFSGKKVSFAVSDSCYLYQDAFPTFNYINISN